MQQRGNNAPGMTGTLYLRTAAAALLPVGRTLSWCCSRVHILSSANARALSRWVGGLTTQSGPR